MISDQLIGMYIGNTWDYNILDTQFYHALYNAIMQSNSSCETATLLWSKIYNCITLKFKNANMKYVIKADIIEFCYDFKKTILLLELLEPIFEMFDSAFRIFFLKKRENAN